MKNIIYNNVDDIMFKKIEKYILDNFNKLSSDNIIKFLLKNEYIQIYEKYFNNEQNITIYRVRDIVL